MEKRTVTGNMLSGGGDNTPLPKAFDDCSEIEKILLIEIIKANKKIDEQGRRITRLEEINRKLNEALTGYADNDNGYADSANEQENDGCLIAEPQEQSLCHSQGGDEEPIMELPDEFEFSLRHDTHRANLLISIIREKLAPVAMSKNTKKKFRWCHIRFVMTKHSLLKDYINHTQFGRAIETIMERRVTAGNIRKSGDDDFLKRKDCEKLKDWTYHKEACLEVEYLLRDVIR